MRNKNNELGWLEHYAPPGIAIEKELKLYVLLMAGGIVWSMGFVFRYLENRNSLYVIRNGRKVLMEGAMMPAFGDLSENVFELFYFVLIYCVIIAIYHYFYHYQGSKIMYLMRRLPNKWELHTRCLLLPIAAGVIAILLMNILRIFYYAIYIIFTPIQCLPL